ncbi:unnamed protein product [Hermetia illucens]|uniref:Transmembrane protein 65 n=1 Tax=Hermetia illucens TaxID=343691 RepID=A0A7R8URU3_HERIL|nr:uncharacterized protein LOC119652569 isoform X1 [Hermetia illucens]CAD7085874.1 unnamed protein product [Hermetia illucens]
MLNSSRLLPSFSVKFLRKEVRRYAFSKHPRNGIILHPSNSALYSKFTVRDPIVDSAPLTSDRAYELLVSLNDVERTALRTALEKYESQKIKEEFVGVLAKTRWRSKFGRPAKMPALGQVDPTGSYCAVPDDWLKKKLVQIAKPPSSSDLHKLFWINAIPFLGFGFLDNFTMIIAGDYIENLFGMFMCISTMAAAALGNTVSDILGIGSAYYIERMSEVMGLRPPKLTEYQLDMKSSRRAANAGRIIGITAGCLIGMFPLLFMDKKKDDDEEDEQDEKSTKSEKNESKQGTTAAVR